ncbi:MAG: radical SAM protein [Desulfobacterales bacterium]
MEKRKNKLVTAVVADMQGNIFDLDGYAAVGMAGNLMSPLHEDQIIPVPYGSESMMLPDRRPVVYKISTGKIEILNKNPFKPQEPLFPVAIFNSPGYVITHASAYKENKNAGFLPLFSYAAAGWHRGRMATTAICIDKERRQDLRMMKYEKIKAGIKKMQKKMPGNRLRAHLETCALVYGCPAGKNFFLGRFEAPLPTSQQCNAACLGCISLQADGRIPCSQNRISFTPTADEIAEIALAHILRVKNAVVSFGQGCEGDPLFAAHVIEPSIRKIRSETPKGTINMNTNASKPGILKKLFDAGLDGIRISMNSTRKPCYDAYFRPKGYQFSHVLESIRIAENQKKHVAINYLNCPGFTDSPEEKASLIKFLENYTVHMIQWRNLNFDPLRYFQIMASSASHSRPLGMKLLINQIRKLFPNIQFGYFNPPKEKYNHLIS